MKRKQYRDQLNQLSIERLTEIWVKAFPVSTPSTTKKALVNVLTEACYHGKVSL